MRFPRESAEGMFNPVGPQKNGASEEAGARIMSEGLFHVKRTSD
jgi:hypothetical protein